MQFSKNGEGRLNHGTKRNHCGPEREPLCVVGDCRSVILSGLRCSQSNEQSELLKERHVGRIVGIRKFLPKLLGRPSHDHLSNAPSEGSPYTPPALLSLVL